MTRPLRLDDQAIFEWLGSHSAWRRSDGHLVRDIRFTDYPATVQLLAAQVGLAQRLDHHPVVTVGYCQARFELWTHDRGGLTQLDLDYAEGLDLILVSYFADAILN